MKSPKKFKIDVFKDNRGSFIPIQIEDTWIQSNLSLNETKFTWRGLHFQEGPRRQSKYVSVIKGKIIDILVNLVGDKLGEVQVFELSEGEGLFVPKGYAHGFLTLSDNTIVSYFVDEIYSKAHEVSIHWTSIPDVKKYVDTFLGDNKLIISQKDNESIDFNDYLKKI